MYRTHSKQFSGCQAGVRPWKRTKAPWPVRTSLFIGRYAFPVEKKTHTHARTTSTWGRLITVLRLWPVPHPLLPTYTLQVRFRRAPFAKTLYSILGLGCCQRNIRSSSRVFQSDFVYIYIFIHYLYMSLFYEPISITGNRSQYFMFVFHVSLFIFNVYDIIDFQFFCNAKINLNPIQSSC